VTLSSISRRAFLAASQSVRSVRRCLISSAGVVGGSSGNRNGSGCEFRAMIRSF
jgi:hypothetical protein